MKKILIGLVVLVVIVAAGVFVFPGNLNDIVRAAVEKVGSDMTQTNVTLNEVDIEITSGKGATPEEIADQVMQAILKGAQDAVTHAKIDVSKLTGGAMEQVGKAAEDAKKAPESVTSGGSDIGKDAGSAIKGLLGK